MCSLDLAEVFRRATKRPFRERRPAADVLGASVGLGAVPAAALERFPLSELVARFDVLRGGWKGEGKVVFTGSRAYVPQQGDWRACR